MAYFRRDVQDHVTKMTKELYDNLQDGIDESKGDIKTLHQEEVVLLKEESTNTGGVISNSKEDVFSEDKEYKAGDLVIYNNVLYKFIEDKSPGEWVEEFVYTTTVIEEILNNSYVQVLYDGGVIHNPGSYELLSDDFRYYSIIYSCVFGYYSTGIIPKDIQITLETNLSGTNNNGFTFRKVSIVDNKLVVGGCNVIWQGQGNVTDNRYIGIEKVYGYK